MSVGERGWTWPTFEHGGGGHHAINFSWEEKREEMKYKYERTGELSSRCNAKGGSPFFSQ
jgi:hypothetical protein